MGGFREKKKKKKKKKKKNQLKNINTRWKNPTNENALNMSKFPYQYFILPSNKMLLAR